MPNTVHSPRYRALIDQLSAFRADVGLTQQAVADRLGRPQSYVAKVEGYERRLDVIEFLELAAAMGVDPMPIIQTAWREIRG